MRWMRDHRQALMRALARTRERFGEFVVMVTLLGVLLAVPGWLAQAWLTMRTLVPDDALQSQAVVFLQDALDLESRLDLERTLETHGLVAATRFVPKAEALDALSRLDGLAEMRRLMADNPLPDAIRVWFIADADAGEESGLMETLATDTRVLSSRYYPSTRARYQSLVEMLAWLVGALALLSVLGVLASVFVLSMADAVVDQKRIRLYTLLGASHGYIKRVYLYRACFLGIAAGLISALVIWGINAVLSRVLAANLESLDVRLGHLPVDVSLILTLCGVALLASWIGAERAVHHQLKSLH